MPGCSKNSNRGRLLDPRTKLVLTAFFTALVFFIGSPAVAAAQMAAFISLCLAGKIPIKKIFPPPQFFLPLLALVVGLQAAWGQGLLTGLMLACRAVTLCALMPLLVLTTDARLLALGITRLGLNYRAAYIITSTLNLVPFFEEEARQILDARKLRGAGHKGGALFFKLKEYPAIALPLMIKVMRHAHLMGLAMDARAFGAYPQRTWLQEIKMSAPDYWAFAAGAAWAAAVIAANALLQG